MKKLNIRNLLIGLVIVIVLAVVLAVMTTKNKDKESSKTFSISLPANFLVYQFMGLTVLFCVLPFLSMLSAALQPQGSMPEGIQFTAHPHWENFIDAWNMANITPLLLNSCILVIVVVPCVVIFCSLGGYAFAQLKVPCKGLIYVLFLVGLTIPFETLVTPLYYEISGMGLLNTRLALILPLIGLNIPFGIVWMRSCFEQMPRDLIEAASIDGAGHLRTFRSAAVGTASHLLARYSDLPGHLEPVPVGCGVGERPEQAHDGRCPTVVRWPVSDRRGAAQRGRTAHHGTDDDPVHLPPALLHPRHACRLG